MLFCHFGEFLLILLTKNLILRFFVHIFSLIKNYWRFYDLCILFLLHFHWGQASCDLINIFFCVWLAVAGLLSGLGLRPMRLGPQASIIWLLTFSAPGTRVPFDHCCEHTIKFNCQVWYLADDTDGNLW